MRARDPTRTLLPIRTAIRSSASVRMVRVLLSFGSALHHSLSASAEVEQRPALSKERQGVQAFVTATQSTHDQVELRTDEGMAPNEFHGAVVGGVTRVPAWQ